MATEKYVAGSLLGLSWATCGFSTELNSLANTNSVLAAASLDNSSTLDVYADASISLGSVTPGAGSPFITLAVLLLNQDASSYGDGRGGSAFAANFGSIYWQANIPLIASSAGVLTGSARKIDLPPGVFKFGLTNLSGVTLASSANTVKARTYNRSIG